MCWAQRNPVIPAPSSAYGPGAQPTRKSQSLSLWGRGQAGKRLLLLRASWGCLEEVKGMGMEQAKCEDQELGVCVREGAGGPLPTARLLQGAGWVDSSS